MISASEIDDNQMETGDLDNSNLNIHEIGDSDSQESSSSNSNNQEELSSNSNNQEELSSNTNNQETLASAENMDIIANTNNNNENSLKANATANANGTVSDKTNATTIDKKTKIIVENPNVVKGRKLTVKLLDSSNNPIANKKIKITIGKKTYTARTNIYGQASLKINLKTGKYPTLVRFDGDANHDGYSYIFKMKVYKLKTKFKAQKSVIRGQRFYAYLYDQDGKALASKTVYISFKNKTYKKKTNAFGRISLKINEKVGKYKIKLKYKGSNSYLKTSKTMTIKAYNAKTKIVFDKKKVVRNTYLVINLKYNRIHPLAKKKITILFAKKKYTRTTNKEGKAFLKLKKPVGTYKIQINFTGSKGFKKSTRTAKIKIIPNYNAKIIAKNRTAELGSNDTVKYSVQLVNTLGTPISGETVKLKVKCNNFTSGTGKKITKKTIVLSSDGIINKEVDTKRLNDMAKLLRAKGYKVIVSGVGPNYHVSDIKKYKNVCVFSLVGGIDSGMFVDMASSYYQYYLKKNKNQFVLGCHRVSTNHDLGNKTWMKRAHDDNYSPKSFKGIYFPGSYLNKKVHINYVYGSNASEFVTNFLKYAKKGKSSGYTNKVPGGYTTYKLTTNANGYVHLNLPIGKHTVISSLINSKYKSDKVTSWVNVVK